MINITFPDGNIKQFENGITPIEIAKSISQGLARNTIVAKINNEMWDLNRPIINDAKISLYSWNEKEGKKCFWHSTAHIMAEALQELYPNIKFGIGPAIDNGFYYDVDLENKVLSSDDLPKIEQKMLEITKTNVTFKRKKFQKKMHHFISSKKKIIIN